MVRTLYVAAGGGGDAIGAMLLHRLWRSEQRSPDSSTVAIATFAWERSLIDRFPGPRGPAWFSDLGAVGSLNALVTSRSRPISPAGSSLPRLAAETGARLFLLDAGGGAPQMQRQLSELIQVLDYGRVVVVDVGGDVLARGNEKGLRSPLADAMVLAACRNLRVPVEVVVLGAGSDGELPPEFVMELAATHGSPFSERLDATAADSVSSILAWHLTEATALTWAAAQGLRGIAAIRRDGLTVRLSEDTTRVLRIDYEAVWEMNGVARHIESADSLGAANAIVRELCGFSEIDTERSQALRVQHVADDLDYGEAVGRLRRCAAEAADRGIDFFTMRRVAELLHLSGLGLSRFRSMHAHRVAPARPSVLWPTPHAPAEFVDLRSIVNVNDEPRSSSKFE